jgi:cell division protein FtsW (lipid II flippase)
MSKSIQGNLLRVAGGFLLIQTIILSLSPVVRERTWDVGILWQHWLALIIWVGLIIRTHHDLKKHVPDADPYLLPAVALLSGWGLLTIWRLDQGFGARQTLWLIISMAVFITGLRVTSLKFLQRYKYILLIGGLNLTALTLLFGTNPSGFGPRLWLGCCDIYFQPSEPLKLLLIIFLSAYLSEKLPYGHKTIYLLIPALILGGIVILLLIIQRDLGTASIFLALYTTITYIATGHKRILFVSLLSLVLVAIAGYYLVEVINTRIGSWINPWLDPGGSSYQIIQALISVANGGIEGRGLGLGFPDLVPVAISDFIYSAIAEETGLIGTLGLLAIYGIIVTRGFRIALRAPDLFRRYLAAGISTYFGIQTILIVGGNLRLLPLTGVTLPFISYGGSSLLTSFIALLLLIVISNHMDEEPAPLEQPAPYITLHTILSIGLLTSALASGWWSVVRGSDLLLRPDNLRRIIEERYVPRGAILGRFSSIISTTIGETGDFSRQYNYPDLAPITGYSDLIYGQAGLEASLDGYLRGLNGTPSAIIWRDHLLYGMSPPGLDIRLSIDVSLQTQADQAMEEQSGAVVVLNAQSGEILVMASHPTYDPNRLDEIAADLISNPTTPLINRAATGLYPIGSAMEPFTGILANDTNSETTHLENIFSIFGFNRLPNLRMETASAFINQEQSQIYSSPFQVALAAAAFSNGGTIPTPQIAIALNTPNNGWIILPALDNSFEAIKPSAVNDAINPYISSGENLWSHTWLAQNDESNVTWFIAGTPPNWQSAPLIVVVLLEKNDTRLAQNIGKEILIDAMNP